MQSHSLDRNLIPISHLYVHEQRLLGNEMTQDIQKFTMQVWKTESKILRLTLKATVKETVTVCDHLRVQPMSMIWQVDSEQAVRNVPSIHLGRGI